MAGSAPIAGLDPGSRYLGSSVIMVALGAAGDEKEWGRGSSPGRRVLIESDWLLALNGWLADKQLLPEPAIRPRLSARHLRAPFPSYLRLETLHGG